MRKLLFFILLIPAVAALGHDIYMFTQNQDKGFRLSDTGINIIRKAMISGKTSCMNLKKKLKNFLHSPWMRQHL